MSFRTIAGILVGIEAHVVKRRHFLPFREYDDVALSVPSDTFHNVTFEQETESYFPIRRPGSHFIRRSSTYPSETACVL